MADTRNQFTLKKGALERGRRLRRGWHAVPSSSYTLFNFIATK